MALTNALFWYPSKELHFSLTFSLNGKIDHNGPSGTIGFGSQFTIVDPPSGLASVGIHF